MGLHIAHWRMAGKTLAPLELNEVMYTLELGIITAGFLFMLTACLGTLLFGRFFCGWGCHILALQDLCSWILKKLRIRPRPIRSRVLLLVPPLAMLYMFAWPQVSRIIEQRPLPQPRVQSDAQGWASFETTDFWRNLPGPGIALLTFGICGFAIVYVLGSRSFCAYGCPYGVVFRGLDRLSPGRIVAAGDCSKCGICTSVCPSGVIVHEELMRFGTVVNAACVKDLECVSACPNGAVKYGLGRPPLLRSWTAWRALHKPFDFTWPEDVLMVAVFLATLATFRGLYDQVPFLMTLGLGGILSYGAVLTARFVYRRDVHLSHLPLKLAGRLTRPGLAFLVGVSAFLPFWAHCAAIRFHEFRGFRAADKVAHHAVSVQTAEFRTAHAHLEFCRRWGLYTSPRLARDLGRLRALRGEFQAERGDFAGAAAHFRAALELMPNAGFVRYNLAVMLGALGRSAEAVAEYQQAARLQPSDPDIQNNLGFALAGQGHAADAEVCFRRAIEIRPDHADAHFNLARLLTIQSRTDEAAVHFTAAVRLDPRYFELLSRTPGTVVTPAMTP
jgi:polyferredoxin